MKSFLTNENNDLYLDGSRQLAMGEDIDAAVQTVQNKLNTLKGEIQLDIDKGIPYFETIFNQQTPDLSSWESYMIEEAEKVDGVIRVESMITRVKDNQLTYEMTIRTKYGLTQIIG